ncbi:MAG TPA: ATP-dependent Clp protease proteolytic subunit, partial [Methylomirabilota bacterium]|nr:ATP-dependent Clp protease proteolytic subunit [Methylomirabilota bacterium]
MADEVAYIKFFAGVNAQSANQLMAILDQEFNRGVRRFKLLISTPGGYIFHGLSLYNFIAGMPAEVETHNFGSVDSIGVCIYCAGRKRLSVPDARFLRHPVSWNTNSGSSWEIEKLQQFIGSLKADSRNIATSVSRATGRPEEEIIRTISARTTLGPAEAKEFGLVHEIKTELFPA